MNARASVRRSSTRVRLLFAAMLGSVSAAGQVPGPGGGADTAAPVAAVSPTADKGLSEDEDETSKENEEKLPFRGSSLAIDNSATTETLGIGQDYQSRNPTYELAFSLRARYVLWENDEQERSLSLGANLALVREFTNNDATTERGEWTFTDAELVLGYGHRLLESGPYKTSLLLAIPALSFPTSKVSVNNGKILGAGISAALTQVLPLREGQPILPSARLMLRLGYSYLFTRAVVPTTDGIERFSTDPTDPYGRSIPSDQLGSAAFAQHQGTVALGAGLDISEAVSFDVQAGWRPVYKYALDNDAEVCVLTGCVTAQNSDDPQRFAVITLFQTELVVDAPRPLGFAFGYENVTQQLAPDGQRRNMLYSPDARVYASLLVHLDDLYSKLRGDRPQRSALSSTYRGRD